MKKLFSLVALAGMFALMSFGMKSEDQVDPLVESVCLDESFIIQDRFDLDDAYCDAWYDECVAINS